MSEPPFYSLYGHPADRRLDNLVHVERVSDRAALHAGIVEDHRHPHLYQLSLWHGDGTYQVRGANHLLDDHSVTIMPPHIIHGFVIPASTDAVVLSVSAAFLGEVRSWLGGDSWSIFEQPGILPVSADAAARLTVLLDALAEEARYPARHDRAAIASYLQLIAILIGRLPGSVAEMREDTVDARLLRRFLELLEQRVRSRWTLARYAKELGTTPYLLNKASRVALGRRPSDLLRERTIDEAKRLLLFSKSSVAEVGYLVGFEDPAHFGRLFTRVTGMLPGRWRRAEIERLRRDP